MTQAQYARQDVQHDAQLSFKRHILEQSAGFASEPMADLYRINLLGMMLGRPPESCGLSGRCALQFVVEADGSVYPCDFYVLDRQRMGNVHENSFKQMAFSDAAQEFLLAPMVHDQCRECKWLGICRGGCRRDRDNGEKIGLNYFCPAYKAFFEYAAPRMQEIAQRVLSK